METYFRFVLKHRTAVVIACLAVTALAAWSFSRATMESSLAALVLGDDPAYHRYVERAEDFGGDDQLIIGLEGFDLDAPDDMRRLQEIVRGVTALDDVGRVESVFSAGEFQFLLNAAITGEEAAIPYSSMATSPLASGIFVSPDGSRLAMIVFLEPDSTRAIERTPVILREVLDVFAAEGVQREDLHLGGTLAVLAEIQVQIIKIFRLTPLVAIFLLATTWLLFRRLWPVLIAMIVGALAIVWMMGFAMALDRQINVILAICPALILIIAFSDIVHLCSAYLLELARGKQKDDAILATASDVGTACLFTSITTLIGFMGLSVIDVPAFRQVGFVLGFGVAVALLLAMTLTPIMFSWMGPPRPWSEGSRLWIDRLLGWIRRLATTRPWPVLGAFAVFVAASIYGSSRMELEVDLVNRFAPSNLLRRDLEFFDQSLAGTNLIEVFVDLHPTWLDSDFLEAARSFEEELEARPDVGAVISLIDVLVAIAAAEPERPPGGTWVSGTVLSAYAQVARGIHGARVRSLIRAGIDDVSLRFLLMTPETGVYANYELGQEAAAIARKHFEEGIEVEASGFSYLAGRWLEMNLLSQRRALLFSFGMIALVMIVLFRSLRIGLLSLVPNVIPLLALGGVLGLVWHKVDSDIVVVALIAIGIAVDDTIHFLTRYRIEMGRDGSVPVALKRTFTFAGRGIVITSLIFAVGFAPLAFSDYLTIRMIGILLPFVMIVALAADLLVLPALATVGALGGRPR